MKTLRLVCLALALQMLAIPAYACTYLVTPDGTGDFPTIQAAVTGAGEGDIICLSDGTFIGDGNRDIDFQGKAITIRSESGDPEACVIDCTGNHANDHRAFLFVNGEGWSSVIENISIVGGYADLGGALFCDGTAPTCMGCIFSENQAGEGGAIYCLSSSPWLVDCVFSDNSCYDWGGAISCNSSYPFMSGCTFDGNYAGSAGGAINLVGSSTEVEYCVFSGNRGSVGGAVVQSGSSSPLEFTACQFIENRASSNGGAIAQVIGSLVARNCQFIRNTASDLGGGIWTGFVSVLLDGCVLAGNASGGEGGGIFSEDASLTILGSTLVANSGSPGSGVCIQQASLFMQSTSVVFGFIGEGIRPSVVSDLVCCDIFGNEGGDWIGNIAAQYGINGNISADPLFCSAVGDIYTLHSDSPCAEENNLDCGRIGALPIGCGPSTDVADDPGELRDRSALVVSPNPTGGSTQLTYEIPSPLSGAPVTVRVFDSAGRMIRTLVEKRQPAGTYTVDWDGMNETGEAVAAGVYFHHLSVRGEEVTRRAILVR